MRYAVHSADEILSTPDSGVSLESFDSGSVTGVYLWQGPAGRTVLRVAFAGRAGERDAAARLDRAIIRTLWLDREQLAARSQEHRSLPIVASLGRQGHPAAVRGRLRFASCRRSSV